MPEITTAHYVMLSAMIFAVGLFGIVTRKNAVVILMSLELMLNGANLALVAFSRHLAPKQFFNGRHNRSLRLGEKSPPLRRFCGPPSQ